MFWFLPLLGLLGGSILVWSITLLTKEIAKKHIQKQKLKSFSKEFSKIIGEKLKSEEEYQGINLGLNAGWESYQKSKNEIPTRITKMGKQQILFNLIEKFNYQESDHLLNNSLERLQEIFWFNEKNTKRELQGRVIPIDWILEDEESRKIFAGRYYDGEVVSMEEVQAQEIDPELQWELDNQEIVIL